VFKLLGPAVGAGLIICGFAAGSRADCPNDCKSDYATNVDVRDKRG
jgi:hypothetical protein